MSDALTELAEWKAQQSRRYDPWFEIMQFMIAKRKAGLVVFANNASFEQWQREHSAYLLEHFCFYIEAMRTWRFERTFLALVVLENENDMRRVRGHSFDKVWFVDTIPAAWQQEVITRVLAHGTRDKALDRPVVKGYLEG